MPLSNPLREPVSSVDVSHPQRSETEPNPSMQDYYRLQWELLIITLVLSGIIFIGLRFFYDLNLALNYLIGAVTGIAYLRLLGKDVERLGTQKQRPSSFTRFALLIGVIALASQWHQAQFVPIFLGFLTYKVTLIVHMLRTSLF